MNEQPEDAGTEGQGTPEEEEYRRALEEEMRKADVRELVVQSAVGIVNLTARRIAVEDERDLEQAKVGIDVAEALLPNLPDEVQGQVRDAIAQLQVQYAQVAGGPAPAPESPAEPGGPEAPRGAPDQGPTGRSSGLWTPPGS